MYRGLLYSVPISEGPLSEVPLYYIIVSQIKGCMAMAGINNFHSGQTGDMHEYVCRDMQYTVNVVGTIMQTQNIIQHTVFKAYQWHSIRKVTSNVCDQRSRSRVSFCHCSKLKLKLACNWLLAEINPLP